MQSSAAEEIRWARIAEYGFGIVNHVPIVSEDQNRRFQPGIATRGSQVVANESGLLRPRHAQTGIVAGKIARLVLRSNGEDRNAGSFIGSYEAHEVAGERLI